MHPATAADRISTIRTMRGPMPAAHCIFALLKSAGKWTCAEVSLTRSLGYGTYSVQVRDSSNVEPAAVFGMFTWDYAGTDQNYREMAIEMSRWGDPASNNGQYVVQPFYVPANVAKFTAPAGPLTYSIHWEAGRVSFQTSRGTKTGSGTVRRGTRLHFGRALAWHRIGSHESLRLRQGQDPASGRGRGGN